MIPFAGDYFLQIDSDCHVSQPFIQSNYSFLCNTMTFEKTSLIFRGLLKYPCNYLIIGYNVYILVV